MRVLGRLAFAAALLVPIGVAVSAPAGASVGNAQCTASARTVTASPGLLLTTYAPQTLSLSSSGLACTGGFVSGGSVSATFRTQNVRCGTLVGKSSAGTATFTWNAGDHAGITTAKLNLKVLTSAAHVTHGTFNGIVTTTGSNLFAGKAISGSIDLSRSLESAPAGNCTVTQKLKVLPISAIAINIG